MPTTDPAAALKGFLQPVGGYKGYGLSLAVDALAGILSGAAYLTHVSSWVDAPESLQDLGHVFVLIDTSKLGQPDWLAERMQDAARILRGTPAREADRPVLLPGERELAALFAAKRNGVALDQDVARLIVKILDGL
ncbi:malate/lactate dehydrogenase-like protein [Palleronia aestuarii]|uniref:Malate/lactate dehydrogenase-like protein n=1 Tax=Palleronia aestuarii TaxID=568105 RepID=A0A2W7P167_9RHOB|nr:malate/lactate dehydrogenase-like protein [Palleronia aestuarii]